MSFKNSPPTPSDIEKFVYRDIPVHLDPSFSTQSQESTLGGLHEDDNKSEPDQEQMVRLLAEARADGFRDGEHKAQAIFQENLEKERRRVAELIASFQQERSEYYAKVEGELVHLALAIAAKILHRESQVDHILVAGLVKVALEKFQQGTKMTLRVHSEDVGAWRSYFHHNADVEIMEDASLEPQNCILQTELGTTNLGIAAQLKEIEQGFFDLLAQRPESR
jgi:flagellar assembly protein FliH